MNAAFSLSSFAAGLVLLGNLGVSAADAPVSRFGDDADRPDSLRTVAVSSDERYLALAGEPETPTGNESVQLRDARDGRLVHRLGGHERFARAVAFSARGDLIATATCDDDGVGLTRLFEVATGQPRITIDAGGQMLRFLEDGRLLVAGGGRVLVFDPVTGREVGRFPAMPILKDVANDGLRALGVSHHGHNVLEVRDLASGRSIVRLVGCTAEPVAAVLSPDGRTAAATEMRTKTILVWEVLTGAVIHRLAAGTTVLSLTFSPDGRHLLAGGSDRSVRVWEIATGHQTGRFEGHDGAVTALALREDEFLLSGSTDRTAILRSAASARGTALPTGPFAKGDLDTAWDALAGTDAAAAYRSLGLAAIRTDEVFGEMADRVERQIVPVPDADLARLLNDLDHADSLIREQATAALAKAGDAVRPHLERALTETTSPEVRSRLRILLRRSGLVPRFNAGDLLRLRRLIGEAPAVGDEGRRLLRVIADELPDPAVAGEARSALRRLGE